MSLQEVLDDPPKKCDKGTKKNRQGYKVSCNGYKCHADVVDGGIPVSCVVTSTSLHGSQVAIPLATMTAERVDSLYDLTDSTYDAKAIREHSRSLGHMPIIDVHPGRNTELKEERRRQAHANY